MRVPEITAEHLKKIEDAAFFAGLAGSRTGAELKRILGEFAEQALTEFNGYRGMDTSVLMGLRAKWLARVDFQHWLEAEIDAQMEKTEEVALELGLDPDRLRIRSMIENE